MTRTKQPFLFEYEVIPGKNQYTLVYAYCIEEAYIKINKIINPTRNTTEIKLATIF